MSKTPVRETSTDYTHPYRPRPVALLNRVLSSDGRLDALGMVRAAEKQAGSTDFGPEFDIVPLEKLCDSVNREARLTPVGLAITRGRLTSIMTNRLRAEQLFTAHPGILLHEPTAPLVIAGLQRTGTTMLHRLLSASSHQFSANMGATPARMVSVSGPACARNTHKARSSTSR